MKKLHKKHTPKAYANLLKEVRTYVRAVAPQVKFIIIDNLFTGAITLTERQAFKTKPGYKTVELTFKDFDEVKKHYGPIQSKNSLRDEKVGSGSRNKSKVSSRNAKSKVEKQQSKGRNRRSDNVQSRRTRRKV